MIKSFTPEESKDLPSNQKMSYQNEASNYKPSKLTMKFVFGYAAALKVLKTESLGNVNFLLN